MSEFSADTVPSRILSKAGLELLEWACIRVRRDQLLSETDYTQVQDSPINEEQRIQVANYRRALRDVPQNVGDPFIVAWPEKPAFLK